MTESAGQPERRDRASHRRFGRAVPVREQAPICRVRSPAALNSTTSSILPPSGYALINALDIAVNTDSHAVLYEATKVLDPATTHLRRLAAGTAVIAPAGSIVQLPAVDGRSSRCGAVVTSAFNLPAVFIVLAVTALLVIGVSESATVNNIIVAIKVTVIIAFIVVGAFFVNPANWHPFIPEPTGRREPVRIAGVIRAATIVFFAYIGFEAVSTAGQEAQAIRARTCRSAFWARWSSARSSTWPTAAVLTGVISFTKLNVAAPVATAVDTFGPQWGWLAKCIKIGAIAGLSSVVLVLMFGQTRVFYSMSRDGLHAQALAKVHPQFKTPWINTLIVGVVVALCGRRVRHQHPGRPDFGRNACRLRPGVLLGDLAAPQARPTCRVISRCRSIRSSPVIGVYCASCSPGHSASNTPSRAGSSSGSCSGAVVLYFIYGPTGRARCASGPRPIRNAAEVSGRADLLGRAARWRRAAPYRPLASRR